jgi:uncharacterized membrane protein YjfL (UPF0719 family)
MPAAFQPVWIFNALIFSVLGILLFIAGFVVLDKISPYELWKEIVEGKNVALAILIGAMSIGMCLIIAASVH